MDEHVVDPDFVGWGKGGMRPVIDTLMELFEDLVGRVFWSGCGTQDDSQVAALGLGGVHGVPRDGVQKVLISRCERGERYEQGFG